MATPIVWKGSTIGNPILVGDISNIPTTIVATARGNQTTKNFAIIDYWPESEVPDEIDITAQEFLTWRSNTREGILGGNAASTPNITNEVDNNPNINYVQPYKFIVEKAVLGVSQEQWNKTQSLQQETIYFIGRPETVITQPTIFGTVFNADITFNDVPINDFLSAESCALQPQINNLSRDSENPVQARLKGVFREQQISTTLQDGELKVKFEFPNGTVKYADILSFTDATIEQCENVINEVRRDTESTLAEEIRARNDLIRQNEIAVRDLEDRLRETGIQFGLDLEGARREFEANLDNINRQNASILADRQKQFDAQINAKNATISSLQNAISQQLQQINTLGSRIETISSQLAASDLARQGLTNQLSASEAARRAISGQLTASQAERQNLAGQLTAAESARQNLAGQLTAAESARQALAGQLSLSNAERANLSSQLADSISQRQNLSNRVSNLESLRVGLETQLSEALTANTDLSDQIGQFRDQANLLSEQNANLAAQAVISQQQISALNSSLISERQKIGNIKNTIEKSLENGSGEYIGIIQQNLGSLSGLLGINFNAFQADSMAKSTANPIGRQAFVGR